MVIIECELEKRTVFVRENPVMGITKLFWPFLLRSGSQLGKIFALLGFGNIWRLFDCQDGGVRCDWHLVGRGQVCR